MRRFWVAFCVATTLSIVVAGTARAQSDDVKRKLEEFDKRLKELEARQAKQDEKEAESQTKGETTVEVQELRRQLDVLAEEVEKIRSGEQDVELSPDQAKTLGLGPAASSIYKKKKGVSIAGYGEALYRNFDSTDQSGNPTDAVSSLDFLRAIVYYGYRFNDRFLFNSEIEVEDGDEVSLEFAYIDYLANEHFNLRGGHILVPMGLLNEYHEPNVYLAARRPETETRIIPSTWHETGVGFFGTAGKLSYRAYVINGLNASGFSPEGIRGGRQGAEAEAANFAFVGRLDVNPSPGVFFGGSYYVGDAGQKQFQVADRTLDVRTTIGEVHGQVQVRGFDLRGLYARAHIDDAAQLSELLGTGPNAAIAETMQGGYLQFGYNLLSQSSETTQLTPYYRFEKVNTQSGVPTGFFADASQDNTSHTLGIELKPIYNIVIKTDYQWLTNRADSGVNQFNVALGYSF